MDLKKTSESMSEVDVCDKVVCSGSGLEQKKVQQTKTFLTVLRDF